MKHMLKWVADNASMMMGPKAEYGSDLALTAAHDIKRFLAAGRNLSLDRVDVEDRVADRNHATGIKSFDALLKKNQGTFMTGNVYGNAQVSTFVRPHTEVHCNGQESKPGELRKFDLNTFSNHGFREFESVSRWLNAHPDQTTIVYALRNKISDYNESGQKNNPNWHCYGYLVTDDKHNLLYRHDNTFSNCKVLDEAIHFLTNSRHENITPWAKVKDGEVEIFSSEVQEAYDKLLARDVMVERR